MELAVPKDRTCERQARWVNKKLNHFQDIFNQLSISLIYWSYDKKDTPPNTMCKTTFYTQFHTKLHTIKQFINEKW